MVEGKKMKKAIKELITAAEIEESNPYIKFGKFGPYVVIDNVVHDFLGEREIATIYNRRGEDCWTYDKLTGLWQLNGREVIKTQVEEMIGTYSKIKVVNEIYEKIKRQTAISREDFYNDDNPNLICLKNGVLNVKTKKLKPFSPDYKFKSKLDIAFKPTATCPKINKFLTEVFYKEDIPIIQEWFGFHLYRQHFIKKALILFGEKNTGKTVALNLLIKFVGEKNKTGISLHSIARGDKFTLAFLREKLANVYDDLSFKDLSDAGGFKIATGGGYVTAEIKFGDTFEFLNYAKNTFATNKIPVIDGETDDAYYLRWLPIPCDNEFPEEQQDKFLVEKLTTKEELSGLLNWALIGLARLLKNGKFSYNKTVEETRNLMEKHSNHLAAFTQDCLLEKEGEKITKDEMYELYTCYAKEKNLRRLTKAQLGRSLEKFCKFIIAKRDKKRYWANVQINTQNTTLKTLLKNLRGNAYRNKDSSLRGLDMLFSKASKPSLKKTKPKDASDTSNQELKVKTEKIE